MLINFIKVYIYICVTLAHFNVVLKLWCFWVSQDIDIKSLLYEAYHKGARELLYVVPFSAKVIESCHKSKVPQMGTN